MKRILMVLGLLMTLATPTYANWIPTKFVSGIKKKNQAALQNSKNLFAKRSADLKKVKDGTVSGFSQRGIASWYGKGDSKMTANGEIFNYNTLTAAHKFLPFNSLVLVRNLINNRQVMVRINDRGPYIKGRIIDLSTFAAKQIGLTVRGIAPVEIQVVQ